MSYECPEATTQFPISDTNSPISIQTLYHWWLRECVLRWLSQGDIDVQVCNHQTHGTQHEVSDSIGTVMSCRKIPLKNAEADSQLERIVRVTSLTARHGPGGTLGRPRTWP